MKTTTILITLVAIIIFVNLPLWDFFLQENYTYSNRDGSFTYSEESGKGNSFNSCMLVYGHFLCKHPEKNNTDITLYRTFTLKPWRFWEWREMIFHSDRFLLPYKAPEAK
jgi:hypothetical protein